MPAPSALCAIGLRCPCAAGLRTLELRKLTARGLMSQRLLAAPEPVPPGAAGHALAERAVRVWPYRAAALHAPSTPLK